MFLTVHSLVTFVCYVIYKIFIRRNSLCASEWRYQEYRLKVGHVNAFFITRVVSGAVEDRDNNTTRL